MPLKRNVGPVFPAKRKSPKLVHPGEKGAMVPFSKAAEKMNIHPARLRDVFSSRLAKRNSQSGRVSVPLNLDFEEKEVVAYGGTNRSSLITPEDFETLKKYFELRNEIREGHLVSVACRYCSTNSGGRRMLQGFVRSNLLLPPEVSLPKVVLSGKTEPLRIPVRGLNRSVYASPEEAGALFFAARIARGSTTLHQKLAGELKRELDLLPSPESISRSLGLRLCLVDAIYLSKGRQFTDIFLGVICHPNNIRFINRRRRDFLDPGFFGSGQG
ncbi:hypothetical protein GF415_00790 [Candidatus Micrarchaeota archaeon]|nr:hypothetical protein [Candidatus Micrarchaeota archaeon]